MPIKPSQEVSDEALARAKRLSKGLYPHQVDGVAFLLARRMSILADDMGLGKTRQSLVAMKQSEPDGPWLITCPSSVKRNWEREIHAAFPSSVPELTTVLDAKSTVPTREFRGWLIINYDIVKKHLAKLCEIPFVGFVFDEAHYLKNHQSQRSKAIRALLESGKLRDSSNAPMVHCLTGTPMTNRPRDLFPLLQLVDHSLGKSFLGFARRYCDAKKGEFGWETKGASNLEELAVQLDGTMLRRTKDEVLDLPEKVRTWLTVDIPESTARRGTQRVLATLLKRTSDYAEGADKKKRLPPLSRQKLMARLMPIRSEIAGAKFAHTLEFAKGILDQGEKVIIFSCFVELIETVYHEFEEYGVRWMTGSSSAEQRQQAVDDFQNRDDVQVFFATVIAGGVGINLTQGRNVIFNDLDWVPANHWQAEDRAYRIGQKHSVNVYYFVARNSIDEFIGKVLQNKSNMIRTIVDGDATEDHLDGGIDVLHELEQVVQGLDVDGDAELTDDGLYSVFTRNLSSWSGGGTAVKEAKIDPLHKPKKARVESLRALARAIEPAKTSKKYRIASSKPNAFYELEIIESDVICSCRGFEFRGQCKHARALKEALANNRKPPSEFELI